MDDASGARGNWEQTAQTAWDALRRHKPIDVQLDVSVLPLFDRDAGQARVQRWRRELGMAAPQPHPTMHPMPTATFLDEDLDGTGWDTWDRVDAGVDDDKKPSPEFSKGATDRRSLETTALYQQLQAQAVAERSWNHKPSATLIRATELAGTAGEACPQTAASIWGIACSEGLTAEMYRSAYGVIPGCSPRSGQCERRVLDGFATPVECAQLIAATTGAMQYLFHQGDQTSLAPASSAKRLGLRGSLLFGYLLLKTRLQIMEDYNLDVLYDSGALLTRISHGMPNDEWEMEPGHAYWNPHVDKANIAT
jgi:hypothetical protein